MKKGGYPTRTQEHIWTAIEAARSEQIGVEILHKLVDAYWQEQTKPTPKRKEL